MIKNWQRNRQNKLIVIFVIILKILFNLTFLLHQSIFIKFFIQSLIKSSRMTFQFITTTYEKSSRTEKLHHINFYYIVNFIKIFHEKKRINNLNFLIVKLDVETKSLCMSHEILIIKKERCLH